MMDAYPEELYDLRERVRKGEDVPPEEYAKIVEALRQNRKNAAKSGSKVKGPSKTGMRELTEDQLLNLFD